jgi:hypothetical protein
MQTTAPIAERPKASPVKVTLAVVLDVLAFALLGLSWMATYEADHPGAFPGRPDESDIDFGVRLFTLSFFAETGAALALREAGAVFIVSGVYLALAVYRILRIYPHLYVLW